MRREFESPRYCIFQIYLYIGSDVVADAFRYDFTPQEFFYFLFKKKKCPRCGGHLVKNKCSEIVDGNKYYADVKKSLFLHRNEVKRYFYVFTCENCGQKFPLEQLATNSDSKNINNLNKIGKNE